MKADAIYRECMVWHTRTYPEIGADTVERAK